MNAPQSGGAERLIVNARHLGPQENRRPRGPRKKSSPSGRMGAEDVDEEEDAGQAPPTGRPPPSVPVAGRGTYIPSARARATETGRRAGRRRDGDENGPATAVTTGYWRPAGAVIGQPWKGERGSSGARTHAKLAAGTPLSAVAAATQCNIYIYILYYIHCYKIYYILYIMPCVCVYIYMLGL